MLVTTIQSVLKVRIVQIGNIYLSTYPELHDTHNISSNYTEIKNKAKVGKVDTGAWSHYEIMQNLTTEEKCPSGQKILTSLNKLDLVTIHAIREPNIWGSDKAARLSFYIFDHFIMFCFCCSIHNLQ